MVLSNFPDLLKVLNVAALLGIRNVSSDAKRVMTLQQFKQWLKTSFGTDSDGRISKSELREALRITGGLEQRFH
ncbi:hypothetical protein P8452_00277 [Trifolium repens]|nr:hypothetical protein P8452_00277 [Trifolium repens]